MQTALALITTWLTWLWTEAKAHPAVTTPIIGALVTLALKPRTPAQYAAMAARNPVWLFVRVAAMLQLLGAIFPDASKATAIILKVITGQQDDEKKLLGKITVSLLTDEQKAKFLKPPPPPQNHS